MTAKYMRIVHYLDQRREEGVQEIVLSFAEL